MATKQRRNKRGNARRAQQQAETTTGPGLVTFVLGGSGVLAVVFFLLPFVPWYADGQGFLSGIEMLTGSQQQLVDSVSGLSGRERNARGEFVSLLRAVGGPAFLIVTLLIGLCGAGLGFAWDRMERWAGRWIGEALMIVSIGGFSTGLLLLLALLNMKVRPYLAYGGILEVVTLMTVGVAGVVQLAALDRAAGDRTAPALRPVDWFIWLSGLLLTTIIHYTFICYQLILPAPEKLAERLGQRGFR